ncbi:MAG: phosphoglycerate dehydrogenase [Desulfuromonas sp.]|nr:MAG: phosphoglycerate dehydrogenase [Desulfuromonas sp.]
MKVLVADKFAIEGLRVFEEADGIELDYQPGLSDAELIARVADAEALVVRGGTRVSEAVLEAGKNLKVVGRAGISVENMDLDVANRKGIVVMNTPFGSATTTAEHTIAMLMALARQIPAASQSTKAGLWEKEKFLGVEISGKILGIVGAGKIGQLVVERAIGLKMRVIVYDPYVSEETIRQMGAEQVDFDTLLAESDFITLHVPLNPETRLLFDAETLAKVKPGSRIINCAMGGLIDEDALAESIRSGQVAGAALDVFAQEPPDKNNPLWAFEQVICTPHLRAATIDAQVNVTVQIARQVIDFLRSGVIVNALNVPAVSADVLNEMRPYIELAEKLGAFQAQLYARGLEKITVEYAGAVTRQPVEQLTMAVLKGLLTPIHGSMVNYVNAPHLASEAGIELVDARSTSTGGFSSMIRLTVVGAEGERSVAGAMFGEDDYRIVSINKHHVETVPEGHILVIHNEDKPGVIATLGQVLAEAGINIAMMNLSRRKIQGKAVSLINVDSEIPEHVLETLRAKDFILSAVQVSL